MKEKWCIFKDWIKAERKIKSWNDGVQADGKVLMILVSWVRMGSRWKIQTLKNFKNDYLK